MDKWLITDEFSESNAASNGYNSERLFTDYGRVTQDELEFIVDSMNRYSTWDYVSTIELDSEEEYELEVHHLKLQFPNATYKKVN